MQELHRKLVQAARVYYQEFVKDRGARPALRRELADTHVRVAQITQRIGERREALATFREALSSIASFPRDPRRPLVGASSPARCPTSPPSRIWTRG